MYTPLALVLYVIVVWWSTTGLILLLGRLPPRSFRWSILAATAVLLAALWLLHWSGGRASPSGACAGFGAAILVWAWLETSFVLGAITGPRRRACGGHCARAAHFWHAVQAILYNELATAAAFVAIWVLSWNAPNRFGAWTFLLLWGMRLSAKLNLHFGVPNVGEAMLPPHLKYLASFFRQRPMGIPLASSILMASALSALLLIGAAGAHASFHDPGAEFSATGLTLLASLSTLGLIEHCMLAISLPADSFWSWMNRPPRRTPHKAELKQAPVLADSGRAVESRAANAAYATGTSRSSWR